MSEHRAELHWTRDASPFTDGRYSRRHQLRFARSVVVPGSASPAVVPARYCDSNAVDPEAAFVASLSGCHMLWFLSLAAAAGYCVDDYTDEAIGILGPDTNGALAMTQVTLRPQTRFAEGQGPDDAALQSLHEKAHDACFIARSVRCPVQIEPVRV